MYKIIKKNYKLITKTHKNRYPSLFEKKVTGIYFICKNISNIKLNRSYFSNFYYFFIILLNNINYTHLINNNTLVISHDITKISTIELNQSIINLCQKKDSKNIIHLQNINIKGLNNNDWLFKSDMGIYYPKILINPEILIDPSNINVNQLVSLNFIKGYNLIIFKRYLLDKISKIIINIKMGNLSYQFKNSS